MEIDAKSRAQLWLDYNIDDASKSEIRALLEDPDQSNLVDSFYKELEFGTGGLRGIMGIGSNRMNVYTIAKATQGLANYLKKSFPNQLIKVVVAHDSRNNSPLFAQTTANVFSANGIQVYMFKELRPTPQLSFAIRHFGCQSGVVVTASHNPKEYNGYKAYWEDGAQITPPHDNNVIKEVNAIQDIAAIDIKGNPALIEYLEHGIDDIYLDKLLELALSKDLTKKHHDLKIVFSSIHGTGITLVPKILKKMGFTNVNIVEEQAEPDGNFPTVVYPNPEETEAMSMALNQATKIDADIIMATDPDSDRVGIGVKDNTGRFILLNGNQTACLLINYYLLRLKETGKTPDNGYIVKTIVTTDLIERIAAGYGVQCYETLTGFKYIATLIRSLEGKEKYIIGGEESYGYLIGDDVRDKDAIASCAIIAEMAAYCKEKGLSIYNMLENIYTEFGMNLESLFSITKKGKEGADAIAKMMDDLRKNTPESINGSKVLRVIDYLSLEDKDMVTGNIKKVDQPVSNVLQLYLKDGSKISARPSGTEPKIKFYFSVQNLQTDASNLESIKQGLESKLESLKSSLSI